jgi:2-amino-1-hydroxyethylphosphonate dioxygenase (glycine-forming)
MVTTEFSLYFDLSITFPTNLKFMTTQEAAVEEVFSLYKLYGDADYIGEPVSQLEHMSQSAQLAMHEGCDDETILAAFFHDIGHICVLQKEENQMGGYGVKSHEKIGADFLRKCGFPERIAGLVENHVQAKRYLTFKYPEYFDQLSEASKQTLVFQGGVMSPQEANEFEQNPLFELSLRMRKWDEMAKEMNIDPIDLNDIKKRALKVVLANR